MEDSKQPKGPEAARLVRLRAVSQVHQHSLQLVGGGAWGGGCYMCALNGDYDRWR